MSNQTRIIDLLTDSQSRKKEVIMYNFNTWKNALFIEDEIGTVILNLTTVEGYFWKETKPLLWKSLYRVKKKKVTNL